MEHKKVIALCSLQICYAVQILLRNTMFFIVQTPVAYYVQVMDVIACTKLIFTYVYKLEKREAYNIYLLI